MSRNKDIKILHDLTGWPYKVCRQRMKDNNWDLWKAYDINGLLNSILDRIPELCNDLASALNTMYEQAQKAVTCLADYICNINTDQFKPEEKQ